MAVQAQYPSNPFRARTGFFDDQSANLLLPYATFAVHPQIFNGAVFSDPESELTCNASTSRKRAREDPAPPMQMQQQILQHQLLQLAEPPKATEKIPGADICSATQISHNANPLIESASTSTSGRTRGAGIVSNTPLCQDLVSCLHNQSVEIDNLIRLENGKLKIELDQARKRHLSALLSSIETRLSKRLREKEAELDGARRRNAELEERIKHMSAENQIWCHVANNSEAIVSNLRATLEQLLLQSSAASREGYGDSADVSGSGAADDTQSCCYETPQDLHGPSRQLRACRACRVYDASVLLLPCRHLCLCKDCESRLGLCPVCNTVKNASLQVLMS